MQYTGWYSSNNQNCTNYRKIKVSLPYYLNGNVNVSGIVFFNEAGTPIASYQGDQQTPEKYLFIEKEIEVPEGASYFIASQYNDGNLISNNQISVELKDAVYDLNKLAGDPITRLDVLNVGDSLTEGDYGSNPAGTKNVKPENYPYFLQKYLGCKVNNKGKSGYTATAWWVNMAQTIDYTQHDIMLIMLGTNGGLTDTLLEDTTITDGQTYLDYADTNTGDYCKIIEHAMNQNKALQIILLTPPHVGDMRPLNKTNAQNTKPVVYKIAERYKLPVIDMDKAGFNDYNQSFFQPIDQLHFGLEGYKRMGTYIGSQVKSLAGFIKI
ncbi:SGNH/GDSL hydrolase family protein [Desemzia sp. RIT804]|uniref:SGNH/GDSL hydrolase family protein n=1 Tax=Desemzia sp. RIT 804 TaxID=2810209 RepID=UPI00194E2CB0|nr:SGNH/GDSL hydrolase family protein [Desemzia sp. RIT 804]MBM6615643.1 SGNH/GDSL hydrolase family protein [Desemzia sp. RIT 804]